MVISPKLISAYLVPQLQPRNCNYKVIFPKLTSADQIPLLHPRNTCYMVIYPILILAALVPLGTLLWLMLTLQLRRRGEVQNQNTFNCVFTISLFLWPNMKEFKIKWLKIKKFSNLNLASQSWGLLWNWKQTKFGFQLYENLTNVLNWVENWIDFGIGRTLKETMWKIVFDRLMCCLILIQ